MNFGITKITAEGQLTIPSEIRKKFPAGQKLIITEVGDKIIIKKATDLATTYAEDLEFAKRTEEAWQRILQGEGRELEFTEFIEEIKTW